ncbi:MAG: bifunctional phosphoserine phosphatase/homoserine phosphotransferase ThrH [Coriobacteriales bacterium]
MYITCLDMEGVLTPEIWIEFAQAAGIPELERTTRDEPDYDKLMQYRIDILREHGLGIKDIQKIIATLEPLPGAREFLDELRSFSQVVILSDTFEEFAMPLVEKLGRPTIICNSLVIDEDGMITGHRMRCEQTKLTSVRAFHEMGMEVVASGDSHNDLGMIQEAEAGFLFRTTPELKEAFPAVPAYEEYAELLQAIRTAQGK